MSTNEIPLIPRKLLFGNPDKTQARISPDGKQLSYIAPVKGVLNVWVGPVENPEAARPVTNDTNRGIRFHQQAYTSKHILFRVPIARLAASHAALKHASKAISEVK